MNKNIENEIIKFLESHFPKSNACDWDFVGYSIKQKNQFQKVLICLDVNKNVVDFSIKNKVSLIISFHPFRFGNSWQEIFKYDSFKKELVKKLKINKINVFSLHTNFEKSHLNLNEIINKIKPKEILNKFEFSSILKIDRKFNDLVHDIKKEFNFNVVLTNVHNNITINNLIIFPGSGDIYEFLKINKKYKIDLLITSDIKWNEQQLLNSEGINFLIVPHNIENVFVDVMANILWENFGIKAIKSKEKDFIKGC